MVNLADSAVEGDDSVSVISSVHDQVLAHDSETDEAEISTGDTRILADVDAGKMCAKVSTRTMVNVLSNCISNAESELTMDTARTSCVVLL